ncbi:CRISPR-associated helicase Cas3' [Streptomyces lydicus]|uniref:CRISPR-associated helicase Cas3' n=1 Tax=Streptomyces lydicus TaxID=47763 RepID=UPI00378C016E
MAETQQDRPQAWLWVVGKTDLRRVSRKNDGPLWNPLFAHMLDAAACAECLWDHYLPPFTRARLAEAFGGGDESVAKKVVMVLAALHDLGKAAPCFLRMVGDSYRGEDPELQQAGREWRRQARTAGLPLPDDSGMAGAPWARHEHVTAEVLPRILGCECRRRCGGTGRYDSAAKGLHAAADILGGHHGHIPSPVTVQSAFPATAAETVGGGWEPVHEDLVDAVLEIIGVRRNEFAAALRPHRPSAIPLALGLIVISDWLASDENRFPYRRLGTARSGWWKASRDQARQAVDELWLKAWPAAPGGWPDLYPDTPMPRPFQAAGLAALPKAGPMMMLVESDTGSGKTKLALAAAHHVAQVTGAGGIYQAMPTRASAGQVAGVLERFLRSALPSGVTAPLAVVHGTAKADSRVHALLDAGENEKAEAEADLFDLASFMGLAVNGDHTPRGGAVLDEWYLRRWLGLVSPFAVGTVDQVVLGSQRSKHWAVRLFGLCTKTVIIDEAHAYELYQQRLLDAAVAWLADAGTSVVVLSATLPAAIRTSLIEAWCRGHQVMASDDGAQGPITVIDAKGTVTHTGPTEAVPALWTAIDLQPDPGVEALAERIVSQVEHGGILAVLRTRVDPCVELFELVRQKITRRGWDTDEAVLLHSRFMPRDRQPLEETIEAKLGPNADDKTKPNLKRPKRLIVIATQVIEQSLDIDFDFLITDLAPTDLLIQRRGRVHRHQPNDDARPSWCWHAHLLGDSTRMRMPKMQVLYKPGDDGLPIVEPPEKGETKPSNLDGLIYSPYPLLASWRVIRHKQGPDGLTVISTPGDSAELIEAVYGERQTAEDEEGQLLDRTWSTWQANLADEDQEAESRLIAPYDACGTPVRMSELASGEDIGDGETEGSGLRGIKALSRLGEPTISAIAFYQQADGTTLSYDPDGKQPVDLRYRGAQRSKEEKVLHRKQQTNLLLNALQIPAHWFAGKKALPEPRAWPTLDHPPVRRSPVALLTPDGTCVTGPIGIRYSPLTGLERI